MSDDASVCIVIDCNLAAWERLEQSSPSIAFSAVLQVVLSFMQSKQLMLSRGSPHCVGLLLCDAVKAAFIVPSSRSGASSMPPRLPVHHTPSDDAPLVFAACSRAAVPSDSRGDLALISPPLGSQTTNSLSFPSCSIERSSALDAAAHFLRSAVAYPTAPDGRAPTGLPGGLAKALLFQAARSRSAVTDPAAVYGGSGRSGAGSVVVITPDAAAHTGRQNYTVGAAFAAHCAAVVVDVIAVGPSHGEGVCAPLSQVAELSSGLLLEAPDVSTIHVLLTTVVGVSPPLRSAVALPVRAGPPGGAVYSAAVCSCHGESTTTGAICSTCFTVFCSAGAAALNASAAPQCPHCLVEWTYKPPGVSVTAAEGPTVVTINRPK